MNVFRIACRIAVGILFVFSGYVKAIDPVGSEIIFTEYFKAFHMEFFLPWAPFLISYLASAAEFLIGCCALMGVRMKETAWAALVFMLFFTALTFVLAITNLVTDCGCFGNAIKMTNWQTFLKNIVILPFVIVIFLQRRRYRSFASCRTEWITAAVLFLLPLLLSFYCYRHLPLIDFMAYKVGVNIEKAMSYPDDAAPDEWETLYRYEKEGRIEEFTKQNYPWQDSTWRFVDSRSVLKKKGYEPPIHDFTIASPEGDYLTDSILHLPGHVCLLILPHVEQASKASVRPINALADYCLTRENLHFFALSSADERQNTLFSLQTGAMYPFFTTDEKPLLSIVRSNPGLVVLRDATVVAKYSHFDIPTPRELEETLVERSPNKVIATYLTREQLVNELLLSALLVAMVVWGIVFRRKNSRRRTSVASTDI
jgi:uncharacterized membrane protein YphA (DoxX/SURF4 family)